MIGKLKPSSRHQLLEIYTYMMYEKFFVIIITVHKNPASTYTKLRASLSSRILQYDRKIAFSMETTTA